MLALLTMCIDNNTVNNIIPKTILDECDCGSEVERKNNNLMK